MPFSPRTQVCFPLSFWARVCPSLFFRTQACSPFSPRTQMCFHLLFRIQVWVHHFPKTQVCLTLPQNAGVFPCCVQDTVVFLYLSHLEHRCVFFSPSENRCVLFSLPEIRSVSLSPNDRYASVSSPEHRSVFLSPSGNMCFALFTQNTSLFPFLL